MAQAVLDGVMEDLTFFTLSELILAIILAFSSAILIAAAFVTSHDMHYINTVGAL